MQALTRDMTAPSSDSEPRGLLASVSRLGITILSLAENKCALFANEWEIERIWLLRISLRLIIAMLAFMLASLFAAGWLVLMLWDWNHSLAVLTPCAIFALIGVALWRSSLALSAAKSPAFSKTREELRKDRAVLAAFNGGGHG